MPKFFPCKKSWNQTKDHSMKQPTYKEQLP
jgi:hypothetical protein